MLTTTRRITEVRGGMGRGGGRWSSAAALFASAVLLSGCYRATLIHPQTVRGEEHDRWNDFFVFGLIGHEEVQSGDFCGETAVSSVRTGGNFATGLVGFVTLGIYTPRKVYVTCESGASPATGDTREPAGEEGAP